MPLLIERQDITKMNVDAIVNSAHPQPVVGGGVDDAIHRAAGPDLLEARRVIGTIPPGNAMITPAFRLPSRFVIHAVGPVWENGNEGEIGLLRDCYRKSLGLAVLNGCTSIAFPLISAGVYGFPRATAFTIAREEIAAFLTEHELEVHLVVYDRTSFLVSEGLAADVKSYIDDRYVERHPTRGHRREEPSAEMDRISAQCAPMQEYRKDETAAIREESLEDLLRQPDETFSETLLRMIDRSGRTDADVYRKANIDKKLFSKIRSDPYYHPKKTTAVALALSLRLTLPETLDLIGRAGYTFTRSSKFDLIVGFCIERKNYDVFEVNGLLYDYDQPLLGFN